MKQSRNTISDWLDKYGDPEIDKQVEKELEEIITKHQREMTLEILRYMAWERAKGELQSMLQTYVNDQEKFDILKKTIESFIKDVEDNGQHE